MLQRFTVAVLVACGVTLFAAAPAGAQPPPPCELALAFLCRYIPMAPELDHDIDLTQQQPPADPCAAGCI